MLFTIAIPTYNNAPVIENAIKSALNQKIESEYEILIVNNASTDNTIEVLSAYKNESKIRILTNETNVDMYENHNICLSEAKGDYVIFLHSDDELFSYSLSLFEERIKQRNYPPRYIIWGHSMYFDYQNSIRLGNQDVNQVFSGSNAIACFLWGGLTPSGTCYSRKSVLEIGGFSPMKTKITPCDWYILFWASFNFFEFEMMDRMLLKRTVSSTGMLFSEEERKRSIVDMFEMLFEKLTDQQREQLLGIIYNCHITYLVLLLANYFNKRQIVRIKIREKLKKLLF